MACPLDYAPVRQGDGHSTLHFHRHTLPPSICALCQHYSHAGTAKVDLINLPFIQTANYTPKHNPNLHSTIEPRDRQEGEGLFNKNKEPSEGHAENKVKADSRGFITLKPLTSVLREHKLIFSSHTAADWLTVRIFMKSYLFPVSLIKELMLC